MGAEADSGRGTAKVMAFAVALALGASALVVTGTKGVDFHQRVRLPLLLMIVAFAVAERFTIDFEVRSHTWAMTLVEVPMVLGFFALDLPQLVAARVLGGAVCVVLLQRTRWDRALFNIALFALEAAVAGAVFRTLVGGVADPLGWTCWIAAICTCVLVMTLVGALITGAVRLSGADAGEARYSVEAVIVIASFANSCLALIATILLLVAPAALALLGVLGLVVFLAYRGYASLAQRHVGLEQLYGFTRQLAKAPEVETAIRTSLSQAREVLRARRAELLLLAGTDSQPDVWVALDPSGDLVPMPIERDWHDDDGYRAALLDGVASLHRRPMRGGQIVAEVSDHIIVPLMLGAEAIGAMAVRDRTTDTSTFTDEDLHVFETLANHTSVSLENGRLIDRLRQEAVEKEFQAAHDALTGLGNRRLFVRRLQDALREMRSGHTGLAVLMIDLNRFKDVNDTFGHQKGDVLLREVADRLSEIVPDALALARLGGDEFAVLVASDSTATAMTIAARVRHALELPVLMDGLQIVIGGSVGVAQAPEHGEDSAVLLQHADAAVYAAKELRTTGVSLYDPDRDRQSARRLALATDLRIALAEGQLVVFFQPQASLKTGAIVGVEALLRWPHPEFGLVPPDEFVEVAENVGLITELTRYVMQRAIDQCRAWQDEGIDIEVAINVSARNLLETGLVDDVAAMLTDAELPGDAITLEITETEIMADPEQTIGVLEELSKLGPRLAIDDFGTGYSSLSYLRRLPADEVKIDKSFVMDMLEDESDATITRSIIDLARNLGLRVIAEGVEDRRTWEALAAMGCDRAQGYYLSRPIPACELTAWLRQRTESGAA